MWKKFFFAGICGGFLEGFFLGACCRLRPRRLVGLSLKAINFWSLRRKTLSKRESERGYIFVKGGLATFILKAKNGVFFGSYIFFQNKITLSILTFVGTSIYQSASEKSEKAKNAIFTYWKLKYWKLKYWLLRAWSCFFVLMAFFVIFLVVVQGATPSTPSYLFKYSNIAIL